MEDDQQQTVKVENQSNVLELVVTAIRNLDDPSGSTAKTISRYISSKYDVKEDQVTAALKAGLHTGMIIKARGGNYKRDLGKDSSRRSRGRRHNRRRRRRSRSRHRRRRSGSRRRRRRSKRGGRRRRRRSRPAHRRKHRRRGLKGFRRRQGKPRRTVR